MIDDFFVLRGCNWIDAFQEYFQTHYRYGDCPAYKRSNRGFRCVYVARQTFSKKHTLKGGPWDTQCSPNTLAYYAITFAPQRLQDIGFRCVYPSGEN